MNLLDFVTVGFSLPVVVISLIGSVIYYFILKLFKNAAHSCYIPFILGIFFYALYDYFFISHTFGFSTEVISAGTIAGSLMISICVCIRKIKNKEDPSTIIIMTIEGIIKDVVKEELVTDIATKIDQLLSVYNEDEKAEELAVKELITSGLKDGVSSFSVDNIVKLVLKARSVI